MSEITHTSDPFDAVPFPDHLVSVRDLSHEQIRQLFDTATVLRAMSRREARTLLAGSIVATLFFQPSTRTRLGFEASALRLGASVIGFADPSTTRSVDYIAEPLEDTVQVVGGLADVIVMRHYVAGAARRAAHLAGVPVVNGGDGSNEHPTQALADTWLMSRRLGDLRGAVVGLVGDPGTRVLRSLVLALARLEVRQLLLVVPPHLPISALEHSGVVHTTLPPDLRALLEDSKVAYEFRSDVCELLQEADAIEMMPVSIPSLDADPKSLSKQQQATPERYRITAAKIKYTGSRALVMHPGPRSEELHRDVDALPNGLYFEQVRESVFLRMAALAQLTGVAPAQGPAAADR